MNYKKYVKVKDIIIEENSPGKCRYLAEYELDIPNADTNDKKRVATIILKNPSKADKQQSDQTVNKVLEYMYRFQYSRVYIVNLIPVYATNSSLADIELWHNPCVKKKNKKRISEAICKADKIFVGWGGNFAPDPQILIEQIEYVNECVSENNKKMYCYTVNKSNKQPRHPCRNGWKGQKPEEMFEEFHVERNN